MHLWERKRLERSAKQAYASGSGAFPDFGLKKYLEAAKRFFFTFITWIFIHAHHLFATLN